MGFSRTLQRNIKMRIDMIPVTLQEFQLPNNMTTEPEEVISEEFLGITDS